jgi:STE24 endopeptidase
MRQRVWRWLQRLCRAVALAGLVLLGGLVPVYAAVPAGGGSAPAISGAPPTPEEAAQAQRRATQGRLLLLGSALYNAALLGGLLLLGGTRWLARRTAGWPWGWAVLAVALGLSLAGALLTLPLDYYAGFVYPHAYGLSNQTPAQWFRDYGVGQAVSAALGLPLVLGFFWLLRRAPRTWWLWTAGLSVPLSIVLMLVGPLYIAPLFNTFTPLRDAALRDRILALAHAQGIPARDVFEVDASRQSRAANAYVVGVGPTHRIVLYDTLLRHFTADETLFILAHEMGHYKQHHIAWGIALSVFGTLAGGWVAAAAGGALLRRWGGRLGVAALGDPAAYPVLLALGMAISVIATPLGAAVSRAMERQADRFAVRAYPRADAGISAFHKLARLNVAEETPPAWAVLLYGTHPSLAERIAALRRLDDAAH